MAKQRTSHPRRKRRRLVLLFLLLAILAGGLWWDNCTLTVEEFTYVSSRLPAGFDGFRIVQLSDLHEAEFGEGNETLLSQVAAQQPDLIAVTGDLVDRFQGPDPQYVDTLCRGLTAIAPTYFVTGNHEWAVGDVPELKAQLEALGVTVLSNDFVTLERNGDAIVLAGIDDPNGYADQKTPEELAAEVKEAWGDGFWLLLAHRNDHFATQYSRLGADLVLSGHGHGGVIRLPFTDGLLSTDRTFFPSYTAGFYQVDGADLFVSRGLGNSGPMLRVFNRPQVVVLTLRRDNS